MQQLTILLLGAPAIFVDGVSIQVDTRKAIAMVAYLALNPGVQTRDGLAALLWPELDQSRARAALRRTLSVLNKSAMSPWLAIERTSVELRRDPCIDLDVAAFHRALAECLDHGHDGDTVCARCIAPLTEAVDAYRDDFLAGFSLRDSVNYDDWQFFTAEELRRSYVQALDRLVSALAADGQFDLAIDWARRRLHTDSLHEAAHRQLMRLFVWADQRNAALRQYRECVRVLDDELGVPPLDETTELYEEIFANRAIHMPSPVQQSGHVKMDEEPVGRSLTSASLDLVGREAAWLALEKALAGADSGHLVIVEGEAGIGKTALVERFLAFATERGCRTLSAQCFYGEADLAYAPIRELLRDGLAPANVAVQLADVPMAALAEARRLLPELDSIVPGLSDPPAVENISAKGHFFDSIGQVLTALTAGEGPTVVAIDNIHWADNATLELVSYLSRRLPGQAFCLVLAWRTEDFAEQGLLRTIRIEAIRSGLCTDIVLERLTSSQVQAIVAESAIAPTVDIDRLSTRLQEESAGIPLFLTEYVQLLCRRPDLIRQTKWELPSGIRDLLQSRLDLVSDTAKQLLAAAAVIGRSFDYEMLHFVSGRSDDECVGGLEELLAHRLVRETDWPGYDFYHDQLRDLVYTQVSGARRRLLHRRAADAILIALRRERADPHLLMPMLAHHRAEGDQIEEAIGAYLTAAEHAASIYANREAILYLETALALGSVDLCAIHERLGDLQTLLGEYERARANYETAAAHALPDQIAQLEGKLGNLHHRLGRLDLAQRSYEAALDDGTLDRAWQSRILARWSLVTEQAGDHEHALRLAQSALEAGAGLDDSSPLAQAHNVLSILARHGGLSMEAITHAQSSLDLVAESDAMVRIAALNSLAMAYAAAGESARAITLTDEALAACLALGDRHRAAALYNHLADYHHALGQNGAANDFVKKAVRIFAEINADGVDLNPAIWMLVEW
jgi:DNA-binding SARP family transcriptional activator